MKEEQSSNHSPALLEENGFPSLKKNGWESILRPCEKYNFFKVVALGGYIFSVVFCLLNTHTPCEEFPNRTRDC